MSFKKLRNSNYPTYAQDNMKIWNDAGEWVTQKGNKEYRLPASILFLNEEIELAFKKFKKVSE